MPTTTASIRHINHVLTVADGQDQSVTNDVVSRSWLRSVNTHKIDPASTQAPQLLTAHELRHFREPALQLIEIARPELDHLYHLVRPTHYAVLLCDKNGVVIDHRGEESEAEQFRRWGSWIGGVWAEDIEGTNGIGTCIAEQRAVTVHRSQHFRARHIDLSCSGAPIFGPHGELVGILDVSSIDPTLSEHAHALTGTLAAAAARAIEERAFRAAFLREWILAMLVPDTLRATMLFAVDHDQRIVGADVAGRRALAKRGYDVDTSINISEMFAGAEGLFCKKGRGDAWVHLKPVGSDEACAAIVTSPQIASVRWRQSEMDDFRPRLDMLSTGYRVLQAPSQKRGGLTLAAMRQVRTYVDSHLNQVIELASLAAVAKLSLCHFARAFKQSEGITPHDYVMQRRLTKAREFLTESGLSLSEIALTVGFSDQSHFTRRFREGVGISPGQFRKLRQ